MLRLSVLDQAPISEGSSGAEAVRNSVDLARLAEELGYERYWVAEHHGTPALACASPEALIGPIAMVTSKIRVGSGGVMLPHYSPLRVAESFSMLSGLAPGRIDLGVGRAAGTDPTTAFALQRDRRQAAPDDFPAQLFELMAYLDDEMPRDHPFARLSMLPGRPELPELWLLGSSPQSAIWAAELGLPYAFADFINPNGAEIVKHYREQFTPSRHAEKPRVIAAVWALCAESDEEARRIASSSKMMFTLFFRGQLIPIPPIEKALAFLAQQPPDDDPFRTRRRAIVGSPSTVREGLEAAAREYDTDELMIVTITYEHEARRRSYELIAQTLR
ncbi:MAG TPA: LLM class flavin-dependent oxidoreductase [Thermoanaerobaculia bacterium]|jgi:luciferase family oxidoreductase group 1